MKGFAVYSFPVGYIRLEYEHGSITSLKRVEAPEDMGERSSLTDTVGAQLAEYFAGQRRTFDFPYLLRGTPFQQRVWRALCDIPYGETRTYGQIAAAIGSPKASRAVGRANHENPLWIAVPCHRVIGANGSLTGYGGGLEMKQALLELEAARSER